MVTAVVSSLLSTVSNIVSAKVFDEYYFTLMLISISLYSVLFGERQVISLLKKQLIIGIAVGIIGSIVFYTLDKNNYYFTFEMQGYTWLGIFGLFKILIYSLLSSGAGMILWRLKLLITKFLDEDAEIKD